MANTTLLDRLRPTPPAEKNVGGRERVVRAVVGPTLVILGLAAVAGFVTLSDGSVGLLLGVLALVAGVRMTTTAVTQKCYLNDRLGRNSCRPR